MKIDPSNIEGYIAEILRDKTIIPVGLSELRRGSQEYT